jgi:hypothetical protein
MYVRHSPLNVLRRAIVVVGRQAGRHYQSLLVVVLAQDLVVVQVKPVAHAKPANLTFHFISFISLDIGK